MTDKAGIASEDNECLVGRIDFAATGAGWVAGFPYVPLDREIHDHLWAAVEACLGSDDQQAMRAQIPFPGP